MLKEVREARGVSINQLSKLSGVPERTIRHWESGHVGSAGYSGLKKVADALACSVAISSAIAKEGKDRGEMGKKEARQVCKHGRATCDQHTYRIPQEDFERGCRWLCAMWLACWILLWSVETGLIWF